MYLLIDYIDGVVRGISESCEEVSGGYLMNNVIYPYIGLRKVSVETIPAEVCVNEYKFDIKTNSFTRIYDETTYNAMPKNVTVPFATASKGVKGTIPIISSHSDSERYLYDGSSWNRFDGADLDTTIRNLSGRMVPTFTDSNLSNISVAGTQSITYGNGTYVVVSNNSKGIYYSTNGKEWVASNKTSDSYNCVGYHNGLFIAGSTSAGLLYSNDKGATWTASSIASGNFLTVFSKDGFWVAGSDSTGLYYSTDGMTWTQSNLTDIGFNNVYSNGNLWIACSINNGIYYSADGITWTQSTIQTDTFKRAYYYNDTWIAINESNQVAYSTDGMTWNYSIPSEVLPYSDIFMYKDLYIGRGSKDLYYLNSQVSDWTAVGVGSGNYFAYADNYMWIIASSDGSGLKFFDCAINTYGLPSNNYVQRLLENGITEYEINIAANGFEKPANGEVWTQSNITNGTFRCVYYDNNTWVAGSSSNGLYYSTDGKTWTQSNITSEAFFRVYYDNNTWVAVSNNNNGLYYSTDGKTWTQSNITSGTFKCVYYANNTWVAGSYSNKGLYYSTDGKSWTQSNITSGYFRCVYYGNNVWVAGSSGKGLYYSTDGITWTQSNITSETFYCVYYDNNTWVTGIYYSTDGKTWVQSNGGGSFDEVYYANNVWVACGGGLYYSLCNQPINVYSKSIVTPVFESFTESTVNGSTVYESSNDLAGYIIYFGISPDQQDMIHMINNAIIVGDSILIFIPPGITGAYIDYRIFGRNISAEETDDSELSEGIIEVDPIVIAKINTGVNQKLISPGEGTGAMMYSMDGIHYSLNIPEVSTSGDYMVYYYSAKNAMYRKSLVGQLSVHIVDPEHWVLAAGLGKGVLYSGDGNEWFQSNLKNTYVDEIFQMSDASLVAVTSDGLYYSNKNGAEWEQCVMLVDGNSIAVSAINMEFGMVVSNGQTFVAGGANNNGLYYGGTNARPDEGSSLGKYFTASNITTGTFDLICCVNDTWFAAGEGHLYCSTNGVTWTESNLSSSYVYSICASTNNKFVVSCSTGLYYSTDYGVTWIHSNKTTDNFGEVVYGNNYCVALTTDSTGVYYSEGGVTWNQSNLTSGRFGVVYNHGIWILGSDDNNGLYYSTDGKSWTQSNITTGYIYDINNFGIFIAISSDGILYSTDGKTWSTTNITKGNIQSVSGTESDNLYIATTNDNSGMYYSADGQYWTLSDMKTNNFSGVLFASRSDL